MNDGAISLHSNRTLWPPIGPMIAANTNTNSNDEDEEHCEFGLHLIDAMTCKESVD